MGTNYPNSHKEGDFIVLLHFSSKVFKARVRVLLTVGAPVPRTVFVRLKCLVLRGKKSSQRVLASESRASGILLTLRGTTNKLRNMQRRKTFSLLRTTCASQQTSGEPSDYYETRSFGLYVDCCLELIHRSKY